MKTRQLDRQFKRKTAVYIIFWTGILALSLYWNISRETEKVQDLAVVEAKANLNKDRAFRLWASSIGGIYIPVSEHVRPNPFMAHIPDRDVTSQTGNKLTLINPATILREVGEQFALLYGTTAKITGKVYFNPVNKPDKWELETLEKFSSNRELKEYRETVKIDGKQYLRLMQPMYMEKSCLKCHAISGIREGELRGATGVTIPLQPYLDIENSTILNLKVSYGLLWMLGCVLIVYFNNRTRVYEEERARSESELKKLSWAVEQSASSVLITDTTGRIEYVNPKFTEITGFLPGDVIGLRPNILKSGETDVSVYKGMWTSLLAGKEWHGEYKNRKKNGDIFWSMESISPIKDGNGNITHFVAMFEDINERKMSEALIRKLAYYDPLTDLPNRRSFHEQLEVISTWTIRSKCTMALFYLDLDRFKTANDTLGHQAGDQLLKIIADRLSESLRTRDMVFRLGGDEFAVIATDLERNEDAMIIAEKLINSLREPVHIEGFDLFVTTSIGISLFPGDTTDMEELIKNADIALYHAKEKGRNTFQFYSEKINAMTVVYLQLENDLRKAIRNDEFTLEYQPQIDLLTGKVYGVEALLRWNHPIHGSVPPDKFIKIAEETNLIIAIGEWVIRNVCRQLVLWDSEDVVLRSVSVNVSAMQFRKADFPDTIVNILSATRIHFSRLELEITESALMKDPEEAGRILESLRELGLRVSIDDFGTGYSSLNYLKRFPVSVLKLDKIFIDDIDTNTDDLAIAKAVIALAKGMNLKVIAEGVENKAQLDVLKEISCDYIQGFYFSKPLPPEELAGFVRKYKQT